MLLSPFETALAGLKYSSGEKEAVLLSVKLSDDGQRGVFAAVPIKAGQYVCEYAGEVIFLDEAKERARQSPAEHWQRANLY